MSPLLYIQPGSGAQVVSNKDFADLKAENADWAYQGDFPCVADCDNLEYNDQPGDIGGNGIESATLRV